MNKSCLFTSWYHAGLCNTFRAVCSIRFKVGSFSTLFTVRKCGAVVTQLLQQSFAGCEGSLPITAAVSGVYGVYGTMQSLHLYCPHPTFVLSQEWQLNRHELVNTTAWYDE